jgi:hypothetical protein
MESSSSLAAVCDSVSKLHSKYATGRVPARELRVSHIVAALEEFMECVRYLNTRRSEATVLALDSESAVQDAIYLMLRPWIRDLVPETPTEKIGNRFSIRDFFPLRMRLSLRRNTYATKITARISRKNFTMISRCIDIIRNADT